MQMLEQHYVELLQAVLSRIRVVEPPIAEATCYIAPLVKYQLTKTSEPVTHISHVFPAQLHISLSPGAFK